MKCNLLSLFSGCGGMDIGFEGGFSIPKAILNTSIHKDWIEDSGTTSYILKETIFKTCFANDINIQAKISWVNYFTQKYNEDKEDIYKLGSIVDLVKEYHKGNSCIFPEKVDIVVGGFPCQDFSVSGKRKGFSSHRDHNGNISENIPSEETRGKLYMWMKEVIEITKPKIFIAENVKGLVNLGEVKDIIQSDFSKINDGGYLVLPPKVLHAGDFGIPQSRERVFFIGFRKNALTEEALRELSKQNIDESYTPYPIATHKREEMIYFSSIANLMKPFTKTKDVLLDLDEPLNNKDLSQRYYSKAKYMGDHCQGQKEINLEGLAPTIRSEHHGNIEFRRLSSENGGKIYDELEQGLQERRLTLRECARIQTFPDSFNFVIPQYGSNNRFLVSPSSGYKLVGNAVPPFLAYHIAKKIESNWDFYFNQNKKD